VIYVNITVFIIQYKQGYLKLKKLNITIIIPTFNRYKILKKTINYLSKNSFFFKEIIIVDSSDKKKIDKNFKFRFKNLKIRVFYSKPSISLQRNIGLNKVKKNSEYIMFMDDDVQFRKKSFTIMKNFIVNNKNYSGIGFNLIIKDIVHNLEKLKKNNFFKFLGIYDPDDGKVTPSGWHTKAINLKKDTLVEWLPTQAVIYKYEDIKKIRFNLDYGVYSYLEDLDFSYSIKKKLIIHSKAKYSSNNIVDRDKFKFGEKEIINRFIFIKKFNLNKFKFATGSIMLIFKNIIFTFFKINNFFRVLGNLKGVLNLFIKNY
jgi:glycosyltransferase involved in cell wall biosynthesis